MSGYDRPAVAVAIEVNHMLFSHYILIALGAIVASLFVYRSFIPFCGVYSDLDMPQQRESTVFQNARPGVWLDHLALPKNFHHPNIRSLSLAGPYSGTQTLRSCGNPLALRRRRRHQVPRAHCPRLSRPPRRILLIWIVRAPETLRVDPPRSCKMTMLSLSPCRGRRSVLFVTTPKSSNNNKEIHSPSATVRMVTGKPDVDIPVEMESSRGGRLALWA